MHNNTTYNLLRWIFAIIFLFQIFNLQAVEPSIKYLSIKKKDKKSYKVECIMLFPNIRISDLHIFCWDVRNIAKILWREDVKINHIESANSIWISYEYDYMFFIHYSTYTRRRTAKKDSIFFELLTNNHNIPFVPRIKKDIGFYAFSLKNDIATIHYNQNVVCDGEMSQLYFNNIHKKVTQYFNSFIIEGKKCYEP